MFSKHTSLGLKLSDLIEYTRFFVSHFFRFPTSLPISHRKNFAPKKICMVKIGLPRLKSYDVNHGPCDKNYHIMVHLIWAI